MKKEQIQIIYEDKDILAINKPAGLVVHSDGKTKEHTLTDWILETYPSLRDVGEPWINPSGETIHRPGIVHRIDRDTSGVLLITKTQESFLLMKEKFKNREISKTYHAFVYGKMTVEEGHIDRPIARSRKDFRLWSAQRGSRGELREAITDYKVLKRGSGATFLEVEPKTGRTHQIRVHLKAINFPIVCDKLYAPKRDPILGFDRLALHASSVSFITEGGKPLKIEAELPDDFKNAISLLS